MSIAAGHYTEEVSYSNILRVAKRFVGRFKGFEETLVNDSKPKEAVGDLSLVVDCRTVFDQPHSGWSNFDGNKSPKTNMERCTGLFYLFASGKLTI
ncbi:hypothetical protein AVEN_95174-1 [Araneus ventricosus]|uniref:Uncharacterized protein n=1 Tax=Araneus ventricosus TaxID=182803 RepID=A0A4Y2AH21_ARAVE|nr:hypothetical protein AVEN_95174-1 [Araneus ventricosus]